MLAHCLQYTITYVLLAIYDIHWRNWRVIILNLAPHMDMGDSTLCELMINNMTCVHIITWHLYLICHHTKYPSRLKYNKNMYVSIRWGPTKFFLLFISERELYIPQYIKQTLYTANNITKDTAWCHKQGSQNTSAEKEKKQYFR